MPSVPVAPAATPGFFSNAWQGFGFGAGQSIAANIFRSDPKPATVIVSQPAPERIPSLRSTSKEYVQCMEEAKQDEEACKHLLDN